MKSPLLPNKANDVIIIGGGLIGCSIAYHLAKAGVRALLIEQGELASGASGANFGNIQVQDAHFGLSLELTILGAQRCAGLEAELDAALDYRPSGSLLLIESEPQWAIMAERANRLSAAGLKAELLDRDQVTRLEPALAPGTILGGLYHAQEGQLNPFKLVHALALRAQRSGLEVRTNARVTGIHARNGRVAGVFTATEYLPAGYVVLATGAWTRFLGATAGVDLPARWIHGEALLTEPLPPSISNAMSSASFFEDSADPQGTVVALALKQRAEGNLMLGEAITATARLDRKVDGAALTSIAAEGRRRFPRLGRAAVLRSWGIPVAYSTDNCPLLGPVESVENLYVAAALKSTIVLTPLVGEIIANMITGRPVDPRLQAFAPSRSILPSLPATAHNPLL